MFTLRALIQWLMVALYHHFLTRPVEALPMAIDYLRVSEIVIVVGCRRWRQKQPFFAFLAALMVTKPRPVTTLTLHVRHDGV